MNEIEQALQDCLSQIRFHAKTLDDVLAQYPQQRSELKPLIETALWLEGQQKALSLRDEQLAAGRARLMQDIQRESPKAAYTPKQQKAVPRRTPYLMRLAYAGSIALVVCLILSLVGGGIALAAHNSLPGEGLYPLKISLEEAQAALVSDPVQLSRLRMDFAEKRLAEAVELSRLQKYDVLPMVIENYQNQILFAQNAMEKSAQTSPGAAAQSAGEMQQRLRKNIETLASLANQLPPQAAQAVQTAIEASSAAATQDLQIILTATPMLPSSATPTPNHGVSNPQKTPTNATPSFVPPGQLSKTAASFSPTATNTIQPTLEPSKTPKPTKTVKPANTHKPPTKPPPVKPTKKPKP